MISVIIPYFNNQNTLAETLHSVLASSYTDFEIIIVNDGSDISPLKLLQPFMPCNIQLIEQSNQGVSAARNMGARHAQGEYLFFLDADDLIAPDYFEQALAIFASHKNLKVVCCDSERFGDNATSTLQLPIPTVAELLVHNCIVISSLLKKSDFFAINGFDESLPAFEDWDFWLRLIETDAQVYRIAQPLFKYRIHQGEHQSLSNQYFDDKEKYHALRLAVMNKHANKIFQYFGHPGRYSQQISRYNNRPWFIRMFKKLKLQGSQAS